MTEEYRRNIIWHKLARWQPKSAGPPIPTGQPALDAVLGGSGLPRGQIVEWFGAPSCGKTSVALETVAHLQRNALVAAWIDADRTFDPAYAASLGVTLDRLPVLQPGSTEEAMEMSLQLLNSGAIDLLVVDSAAALSPRLELGAGMGEGAGLQSRILASGLRRLAFSLRRNRAAALFLNQSHAHLDAVSGDTETAAGGPALKLHAAVRIAFHAESRRRLRLRAVKNPMAEAFAVRVLERGAPSGIVKTP